MPCERAERGISLPVPRSCLERARGTQRFAKRFPAEKSRDHAREPFSVSAAVAQPGDDVDTQGSSSSGFSRSTAPVSIKVP